MVLLGGHGSRPRAFDNPEGPPRLRKNGKEFTGKHVNTSNKGPAFPKTATGQGAAAYPSWEEILYIPEMVLREQ